MWDLANGNLLKQTIMKRAQDFDPQWTSDGCTFANIQGSEIHFFDDHTNCESMPCTSRPFSPSQVRAQGGLVDGDLAGRGALSPRHVRAIDQVGAGADPHPHDRLGQVPCGVVEAVLEGRHGEDDLVAEGQRAARAHDDGGRRDEQVVLRRADAVPHADQRRESHGRPGQEGAGVRARLASQRPAVLCRLRL